MGFKFETVGLKQDLDPLLVLKGLQIFTKPHYGSASWAHDAQGTKPVNMISAWQIEMFRLIINRCTFFCTVRASTSTRTLAALRDRVVLWASLMFAFSTLPLRVELCIWISSLRSSTLRPSYVTLTRSVVRVAYVDCQNAKARVKDGNTGRRARPSSLSYHVLPVVALWMKTLYVLLNHHLLLYSVTPAWLPQLRSSLLFSTCLHSKV